MPRNPNCKLCILHQSSKHVCVWGHGTGEGFAVGEALGKAEELTGKPFQGESGQLLRRLLAEIGLEDMYITNAAKCRPPSNRKPEREELTACKPYLLEEIATRKPKAILLMGAIAMKTCINKTGITEMNGQVVEKDGQIYVCAFHPAYILRDPSKEGALRMALARYAAVLRGTFSQKMPDWRAVDRSTFDEFVQDWINAEVIAFDVETTGLEWWEPDFKVNSISFSMSDQADTYEKNWSIALAKSPVLPLSLQKKLLEELARSTGGKIMRGQFAKFDNNCLQRCYGIKFRLDQDAGLAHHIVDENSAHGLKILTRQFLGWPDYDLTTKEKKGGIGISKLLAYNAYDSAGTRRLVPIFLKKMDEDERWLYDRVKMPAARAFEEIEQGGLYVDLDKMANVELEIKKQRDAVVKKLNKMAGQEVNWNAPAQVAEILYNKLGLTPTVFTDKINPETGDQDTPSTSEAALLDIKHPIADLLTEYREHAKNLSTYTGEWNPKTKQYEGGLRDFMIGPHLYISTKLHGTVTGRYSSRLHSIPRDPLIRSMVIAPPGWDHGQLDLSQAELKTIAITAREAVMLSCFRSGRDIHWRTLMSTVQAGGGEYVDLVFRTARHLTKRKMQFPEAIQLVDDYGAYNPDAAIALEGEWKEARKKAKGVNFGFVYDQQPPGFREYVKAKYGFYPSLEEATQFQQIFFDTYPGLRPWQRRQRELAKQDGLVRSMSGRKRHLPGIHSSDRSVRAECERQAINAPIQGFIGEYKEMILVELHETLPRTHFRITMEHHDAILFWVKSEYREMILPQVKKIAENPRLARECGLRFPIPLTVDIELGPWGMGKRWKPQGA